MSLTRSDYKALLETIDLIYSIPDRQDILQTVCNRLEKMLHITSAVFIPADSKTSYFQFEKNFLFNVKAQYLMQYILYYAPMDPLATDGWIFKFNNEVARYGDFVNTSTLEETEYRQDFLKKIPMFHCMALTMGAQGDPIGALGLHRQKKDGDFTHREKKMVQHLVPHLSKALHNLHLSGEQDGPDGIGVIVIPGDGKSIFINDEAAKALNGRDLDVLPDPGLSSKAVYYRTERGTYRVRTFPLEWKGRTELVMIQSMGKEPSLSSRKKAAKIILLEPFPGRWNLRSEIQDLNLSPRQEEIVLLVIQGLSNGQIAERLFICEQTVKDHLRDIFEKMRVCRRSELIARVLKIPCSDR